MEEKALIKSKKAHFSKNAVRLFWMPSIIINILFVLYTIGCYFFGLFFQSKVLFGEMLVFGGIITITINVILYLPLILGYFIYWLVSKNEIIVFNNRILGKTAFGTIINIPMETVVSVSTKKLFKSIIIFTDFKKISFRGIENRDNIQQIINKCIANKKKAKLNSKSDSASDYAEELKKIKELLDMGIITQEEFDAKKKQILKL